MGAELTVPGYADGSEASVRTQAKTLVSLTVPIPVLDGLCVLVGSSRLKQEQKGPAATQSQLLRPKVRSGLPTRPVGG